VGWGREYPPEILSIFRIGFSIIQKILSRFSKSILNAIQRISRFFESVFSRSKNIDQFFEIVPSSIPIKEHHSMDTTQSISLEIFELVSDRSSRDQFFDQSKGLFRSVNLAVVSQSRSMYCLPEVSFNGAISISIDSSMG